MLISCPELNLYKYKRTFDIFSLLAQFCFTFLYFSMFVVVVVEIDIFVVFFYTQHNVGTVSKLRFLLLCVRFIKNPFHYFPKCA